MRINEVILKLFRLDVTTLQVPYSGTVQTESLELENCRVSSQSVPFESC